MNAIIAPIILNFLQSSSLKRELSHLFEAECSKSKISLFNRIRSISQFLKAVTNFLEGVGVALILSFLSQIKEVVHLFYPLNKFGIV